MKVKIKNIFIENDVVNNQPTLILEDESGKEWALSHQSLDNSGAGTMVLVPKKESWYFDVKNKKK